jgi:hypothetical protein
MPDLLDETHTELGLRDKTPLAGLSAAELAWLRDTVRDVRRREHAALTAAVDRAMEHVPWLVRGAVRRILFP